MAHGFYKVVANPTKVGESIPMETNTHTTPSQFGIKTHAQIQTINGRTFEFQPEHLCCDDCWDNADEAVAHASYFGSCTASQLDDNYNIAHSITVTNIK